MENLEGIQEIDELMLVSMIKLNNEIVEHLRHQGIKISSYNIAS